MLALVLALVAMVLIRTFLLEIFYIPSASMEDTLLPGDRIAVWRAGDQQVHRGEIVVFDGTGSLARDDDASWWRESLAVLGSWVGVDARQDVYVKRVIGVEGDTVSCCAADGRLEVNGRPITEEYLHPGDAPSEQRFSVTVPAGRMWVMGDHRSDSADSRSLLGAPGGGMIRTSKVIGRPVALLWPLDRIQRLGH